MDRCDAPAMMARSAVALTIAGSDSGGGAGIQADLKTFAALGVHGASAVTALTAQNTRGVVAIHVAPPAIVRAQIDAVLEDFDVRAIKIGMLGSVEVVEAVARCLSVDPPSSGASRHLLPQAGEGERPLSRLRERAGVRAGIVYDPVMIASSGDALAGAGFVAAVKARLLPLVDCLTPNLAEAAALLGAPIAETEEEMAAQGRALLALGPPAVLMKGGHLAGDGSGRSAGRRRRRAPLRRAAARFAEPARHRLHAVERDRRPYRARRRSRRSGCGGEGFRARGDRPRSRREARRGPRPADPNSDSDPRLGRWTAARSVVRRPRRPARLGR